jgi:hypothetical protein
VVERIFKIPSRAAVPPSAIAFQPRTRDRSDAVGQKCRQIFFFAPSRG